MNLWDDCRYEDDRLDEELIEKQREFEEEELHRKRMLQIMWEDEERMLYEASKDDELY